jgi:four helix bundle protein
MPRHEKRERGDDLETRLCEYGGEVSRLVESLPDSKPGRHVTDQLFRSATSAGANYAEARGAQSQGDFIHKLGLANKEMRESFYWVRLVAAAEMVDDNLRPLLQEGDELVAMLTSALQTARTNQS